ncbi:MAG: hypothetical protein O3C63_09005 [Cyanobacteria bacterium]|nr:hypothetical protein [Cyanobacteriota bacterium]MDA1020571.1 hypothetical protein [Cyanobacteriota bacterium]
MFGFLILIITAAISVSFLTFNSFASLQTFHNQTQIVGDLDTVTLATTNRVNKITNAFLSDLRNSLIASIQAWDDQPLSLELKNARLALVQEYFSSLTDGSQINSSIEFGLNPNQTEQVGFQSYETSLIHSDYLPNKLDTSSQAYASSLVDSSVEIDQASTDSSEFITGDILAISPNLLNQLLEEDSVQFITDHLASFGLSLGETGLALPKLANGISIQLVTLVEE